MICNEESGGVVKGRGAVRIGGRGFLVEERRKNIDRTDKRASPNIILLFLNFLSIIIFYALLIAEIILRSFVFVVELKLKVKMGVASLIKESANFFAGGIWSGENGLIHVNKKKLVSVSTCSRGRKILSATSSLAVRGASGITPR